MTNETKTVLVDGYRALSRVLRGCVKNYYNVAATSKNARTISAAEIAVTRAATLLDEFTLWAMTFDGERMEQAAFDADFADALYESELHATVRDAFRHIRICSESFDSMPLYDRLEGIVRDVTRRLYGSVE